MAVPEFEFLLDTNLGLEFGDKPWPDFLARHRIGTQSTTDLGYLDKLVAAHQPDIVFMPIADFHRLLTTGDDHYRGLAIATSKFTGTTSLPSVLVVRKDDPANGLQDLKGARYGYINKSCSSSYFAPAILLQPSGHRLDSFFEIVPTAPWQGQIDAVVAGRVRATMVPEDIWRTNPDNAGTTRIVGRYDNATPALVVARRTLDEAFVRRLLDALVSWVPRWEGVYGAFRPFYRADVHRFFHDLDQLPPGM
ncbi:MAG: phosphate/phosphite/phosphonate ABC transporter substrate-binding protein [Pseudomonadota bacterium]